MPPAMIVKPSTLVDALIGRLTQLEDWDGVAEAERAHAAVLQLEAMVLGLNSAWKNFGDVRAYVEQAMPYADDGLLKDYRLDCGYGLLGKG